MPKHIAFSLSSLVDLKAELFRKQTEFAKKKTANAGINTNLVVKNKKALFTNDEKKTGFATELDAKKRKAIEINAEEQRQLNLSRERLLQKSKLYEKLASGSAIDEVDDEGNSLYLVNFDKKAVEEAKRSSSSDEDEPGASFSKAFDDETFEPEEEWVDYVDSFGRTRRCMRKDLDKFVEVDKKLKIEKNLDNKKIEPEDVTLQKSNVEFEKTEPTGPVHYQQVSQNEIWDHGAGYYKFSNDEVERHKQMKLLDDLRVQTIERRKRNAELKDKREKQLKARLAKIRERRGIAADVEAEDEKEESASTNLDEILLPGEIDEVSTAKRLKVEEDETKRAQHVRPWDVGKKKIFSQEQWLDKRRQERYSEFAPPSEY